MAINTRVFLAALALLTVSPPLVSATKIPRHETLEVRYVWFDGKQSRALWLNPRLLAEFVADTRSDDKIRQALPSARAVLVRAKFRLWQVDPQDALDRVTQRLQAQGLALSPVLHDAPSTASRKRALPGNIIVYLPPDWDAQTSAAWFAKRELTVLRPLPIGANIFLVASAPGLASLTLANALAQSQDVLAAHPDWWQEVTTR